MGKHSAAANEEDKEEEGGGRRRGSSEDGNNNNNTLECLYSGDRTKPIKTMKDKFELLPAFLKVRGLGARQIFVLLFLFLLSGFALDARNKKY
tara:strand:+ start:221 stop:499 length:279 start_codon:yes stop_codon:yes gene_type:complete